MRKKETIDPSHISVYEHHSTSEGKAKHAALLASADWLLRYTEECFLVLDTDLTVVTFSNNFKSLFQNFFEDELINGNNILDYLSPESVQRLKNDFQQTLQGETIEKELVISSLKNVPYSCITKFKPMHAENGELIGIFASVYNATPISNSEPEAIHENRYKSVIENSLDAFFFSREDGSILDVNNAAIELFGYSLEEFKQLNRDDLASPIEEDISANVFDRIKGEGIGIRKNGERFPFEFSKIYYKNSNNETLVGTVVCNIASRKKAEKLIELSEKRFRALVENAGDIIILCNAEGVVSYLSPAYTKLTGFKASEVIGRKNIEFIHPDRIEETKKLFARLRANPGITIPRTNQLKHKDGTYKWVEGTLTNMLHDESVQAIVLNYHDITARIEAAERIRQSETNLKTIFENTSEAFMLLDRNRIVRAFNSGAKNIGFMNGDSGPEIGRDALDFITDQRKDLAKALFDRVFNGEDVEYDRLYELENGELYWYNFTIKPVIQEGNVTGLCMSARDITKRKLAEEEIIKRELRFRTILKNSHDMLFLFDVDGKIEFLSPSIEKLFGYTTETDLQQRILDSIHPDDLEVAMQQLRLAFESPDVPVVVTLRKQNRDGTYMWLEGTLTNMLHIPEVNVIVANFRDITERKLFEEQQALFVSIVNSSEDAIMSIDLDTTIITWNKGAEKLFGYSANEVIGQSTYLIIPPNRGHEEGDIMKKIQRGESVKHYETQRLTKDKQIVDISLTVSPIRDSKGNITGASKIARNISDKKKAEDIIKNNEKRFRSLLQNSNDGLSLMSVDGVMLEISPAGQRITGFDEDQMVGHARFDLIHPDDLQHVSEAFINVIEHPDVTENFEYRSLSKDGTYKWLDANLQNMLHDPAVGAIVINYRDITDRKNQEIEREKLIKTLNQNNNDLRNFSYITSHNLKAPLSNLMGFLELIDDIPIEDPTLRSILEGFKASTTQLNHTVNDLIKILIIRDNDSIEQKDVAFGLIFEQVKSQLYNMLNDAKPEIITDFDNAPTVFFNETYLESIFMNLLTNAIKYRDYNRPLKIELRTYIHNNDIVLTFADNGIGFDAERHKKKLFGLYQRFHNRPNSKGLGLYLVKSQMESLQGSISVESTVDVGTTFTLRFAAKA